jgi:hypothetical protein
MKKQMGDNIKGVAGKYVVKIYNELTVSEDEGLWC